MTVMAAEAVGDVATTGEVVTGSSAAESSATSARSARVAKPRTVKGKVISSKTERPVSRSKTRAAALGTVAGKPKTPAGKERNYQVGRAKYHSKKTRTGRSEHGFKIPALATGKGKAPQVSGLIAEWLIAVILIFWGVLSGQVSYLDAMQNALWRLAAISGVFFVLALFMRGKNTGRVAIALGALIDLAILLESVHNGELAALGGVFKQVGTGGSPAGTSAGTGIQLTAADQSATVEPTQHHFGATPAETDQSADQKASTQSTAPKQSPTQTSSHHPKGGKP